MLLFWQVLPHKWLVPDGIEEGEVENLDGGGTD
jgi:hypothetical protein